MNLLPILKSDPHISVQIEVSQNLLQLSEEIWINIFKYCTYSQLVMASCICKSWRRISRDKSLIPKNFREIIYILNHQILPFYIANNIGRSLHSFSSSRKIIAKGRWNHNLDGTDSLIFQNIVKDLHQTEMPPDVTFYVRCCVPSKSESDLNIRLEIENRENLEVCKTVLLDKVIDLSNDFIKNQKYSSEMKEAVRLSKNKKLCPINLL